MTDIASVHETYAYLARTVEACRTKMAGFDTVGEIEPEGIRVRVTAADGTCNTLVTSWSKLTQHPGHLPLHAGLCAGELFRMMQGREAGRADSRIPRETE